MERSDLIPALLLFGMPGAGKGTQGTLLGTMQGLAHVSTGDIFRGLDPDSEDGLEVAGYIHRGELVPDEVTVTIWRHWLDREIADGRIRPAQDILMLDGIPRSVRQCELLRDHVEVLVVIQLETDDDEPIVERLLARALTEDRPDDSDESVIRHRIEVYREETSPVAQFYPEAIVHRVDPIGTQMEVKKRILEHVIPVIRRRKEN